MGAVTSHAVSRENPILVGIDPDFSLPSTKPLLCGKKNRRKRYSTCACGRCSSTISNDQIMRDGSVPPAGRCRCRTACSVTVCASMCRSSGGSPGPPRRSWRQPSPDKQLWGATWGLGPETQITDGIMTAEYVGRESGIETRAVTSNLGMT